MGMWRVKEGFRLTWGWPEPFLHGDGVCAVDLACRAVQARARGPDHARSAGLVPTAMNGPRDGRAGWCRATFLTKGESPPSGLLA